MPEEKLTANGAVNKRIWELDTIKGLFILLVIYIHLTFDIEYFGGYDLHKSAFFYFVKQNCGVIFILVSGICVTIGKHNMKRGALVFSFGLLISAVTFGMYRLGFADVDVLIYWGVLHLLGFSMMTWPLYKKWPLWLTFIVAIPMIIYGYYLFRINNVQTHFLFMFGFTWPGFVASDHFPILPFTGWFMIGTVLGRTVYKEKKTLFPRVNEKNVILRFLCWCGRNSLWIYMLHQPVLYLITELIFG